MAATTLGSFTHQRTVALTTFKRSGEPVSTPVNIVVDGDRAFFRTYHTAWKVKRLRRNPQVEIAPSTMRGRVTGPALRARARLLDGAEANHAARLLARKYPVLHGFAVPLWHRLKRHRTLHYELRTGQEGNPGA